MRYDVVIIGAGASGLMCALTVASRGRQVLLIDHRRAFGQKILASGGGRCNFTNLDMHAGAYISGNSHFVKSALARFTPIDMTEMLKAHRIAYCEKSPGQLFLRGSSKQLLDMLVGEATRLGVRFAFGEVSSVSKGRGFIVEGLFGKVESEKLVVATGGLSYPALGASDLGYRIAEQFGHAIVPTRPGLVPLMLSSSDRSHFAPLSGISFRAKVSLGRAPIEDDCLITHKGLSGPAILRISSRWAKGETLAFDLLPTVDILSELQMGRESGSRKELRTVLSRYLPERLARMLCKSYLPSKPLCMCTPNDLNAIVRTLKSFELVPHGTEGYAKAEVTVGGVATHEFSSKTLESKLCPGLHCTGEVLDVTGDLGGYNLHWAWASGTAAGVSV
jgi:hypothetical protein